MRTPKLPMTVVMLVAGLAAGGVTQSTPRYGDLIVSGYWPRPVASAVFVVDPRSGRLTTLRKAVTGEIDQWVGMMENNRDIGLLSLNNALRAGQLFRLSPKGASTLVGLIRGPSALNDPTGAVWDPQGRLLIAAGRSLYRHAPAAPAAITTLFHFPATSSAQPFLQGVAVGPDASGRFHANHYVLNALPEIGPTNLLPPAIYRFDPAAQKASTLVASTSFLTATSLSYLYGYGLVKPRRRAFLATRGRPGSTLRDLLSIDFRSGAPTRIAALPAIFPAAHKVTRQVGQQNMAWVVGTTSTQAGSLALEIDLATGAVKRTVPIRAPTGFHATGLELYGSNLLHLRGKPGKGDAPMLIDLQTNDAALAGKSYVLALAFDSAPPTQITIGTSSVYVNLAPDPLLWTSLFAPQLIGLSNSWGTLDPNGNASASLSVPSGFPKTGLTIYAAWVIYDVTTIYRVSESELFVLP